VLIFLRATLRTLAFTVLIWLRPLVFWVFQPVSGLTLIAFIVCLLLSPHDTRLTYGFGIISFGSLVILLLYDQVLIGLSRSNIVRSLN
jgi:hypothetical protein